MSIGTCWACGPSFEAARWLGKADEAAAWQKEYDDFLAAFRKAAARDMKTDPHGNRYLPILMATGQELPQRGQWGFCHARLSRPDFRPGRSARGRQHGDARGHRARRHGLWHRLGRDRHLELLRLVLRPRLALAGQRPQGGRGALRLRQPRLARARLARGAIAARASLTRRSATCRTTGPAPSSSG